MALESLSKNKSCPPDLTWSSGLTRLSLSPVIEGETCPLLLSQDHELTHPGMGNSRDAQILSSRDVSRSSPARLPPESMQSPGKEP